MVNMPIYYTKYKSLKFWKFINIKKRKEESTEKQANIGLFVFAGNCNTNKCNENKGIELLNDVMII